MEMKDREFIDLVLDYGSARYRSAYLPHDKALEEMANANALFLHIIHAWDERKGKEYDIAFSYEDYNKMIARHGFCPHCWSHKDRAVRLVEYGRIGILAHDENSVRRCSEGCGYQEAF